MTLFKYDPPSMGTSPEEKKYLWQLEGLWWIISFVLVITVMLPIFRSVDDYPFTLINILFILLFFHFARNVVFLKYSALQMFFWLKFFLGLLTVPVLFIMAGQFGYFQTWMDEHTMSEFMPDLSYQKQLSLNNYIKTQMVFFSSATLISGVLFVLRMMLSAWRQVNLKGV
jgi:hypothetical protein